MRETSYSNKTMSVTPTVSILTTVYNREQFLDECIQSVQQSKFKDYEHIIVDDGSTDESVSIAKRYAQQDPKIRVFVNEKNLGDYPNRNEAAKKASGTYLKYLDADDMHSPYILDIILDCMKTFPDAGLGLFLYGKKSTHVPRLLTPEETVLMHYFENMSILNRSPLGAIIKRTAFEALGGFPENQHVGDHELWHRLASHFPVVILPTKLSEYRIHADQQSQENRTDLRVPFKYYDAAIRGLHFDRGNELSTDTKKSIEQVIRKRQARTIFVLIYRLKLKFAAQLKKQSKLSWGKLISNAFS